MRTSVGRYALYGVLAQGGMATVHLGCLRGAAGFSRIVAIKRMLPQYASNPDFVAMFLEEARLAGRVRHPNVVPVIDVVAEDGEVLLVMEYVKGETVAAVARETKRIPSAIACAIACDMLDGLHAAHEALDDDGKPLGIVHRDVSPQNVIIGVDGVARVLDFGIAKAAGRAQVTREGQLKGKLAYMAPEQLEGKTSRASDIWAAGVVLWEMLSGKRLFDGENEGETMHAIVHADVPLPSANGIDTTWDAVVMRALSRSPDERFATAREMSLALAKCAPRAEPHEVGEWIEAHAKERLASRKALVSEVETAITEGRDAAPSRKRRTMTPIAIGALLLLLAACAGAIVFWVATHPPSPAPVAPVISTTSTPVMTTSAPHVEPPSISSSSAVSPTTTTTTTTTTPASPSWKRLPTPSASASVRIPEFL